jgi:hypothetical protein
MDFVVAAGVLNLMLWRMCEPGAPVDALARHSGMGEVRVRVTQRFR